VPERVFHVERARWMRRREARIALTETRLTPDKKTRAFLQRVAGIDLSAPATWAQILTRQDVDGPEIASEVPALAGLSEEECRVVIGMLKYDGYLARHDRERERVRRLRNVAMPPHLDPHGIPGISREVADSIVEGRPQTLADAERLPGMTPAALAIVAGWLSRTTTG
jgi:tRNA uridine 5-carboxymethylaminomethyl modification enzyme